MTDLTSAKTQAALDYIDQQADLHEASSREIADSFAVNGFNLGPYEWAEISAQMRDAVTTLVDDRHQFDLSDPVQAANRELLVQLYTARAESGFLKRLREIEERGGTQGGRA